MTEGTALLKSRLPFGEIRGMRFTIVEHSSDLLLDPCFALCGLRMSHNFFQRFIRGRLPHPESLPSLTRDLKTRLHKLRPERTPASLCFLDFSGPF